MAYIFKIFANLGECSAKLESRKCDLLGKYGIKAGDRKGSYHLNLDRLECAGQSIVLLVSLCSP